MLYITYLANMKNIPDDMVKLIIVRFVSKQLDLKKLKNTYIVSELSPSKELLLQYKENNNWDWYVSEFYKQMDSDEDMKKALQNVKVLLDSGFDVCLICYEKDYEKCHRFLLAKYFESMGYKWKEL